MSECKLKGFQQVLVRDNGDEKWRRHFFDYYDETSGYPYNCIGNGFKYCIPYEGNEHLAGTTNAYVEPYEPKDGDFVKMKMTEEDKDYFLMIYLEAGPRDRDYYYACMYVDCECQADNEVFINSSCRCNIFIPATEEEKQLLLSKLHEIGKDWDAEKKEVVDLKWEPKLKERFLQPYFDRNISLFVCCEANWLNTKPQEELYKKGWVFMKGAKKGCQTLCDKLNAAIKDIK